MFGLEELIMELFQFFLMVVGLKFKEVFFGFWKKMN